MQRRKKKGSVAVTVIAALLILVAVTVFAVQCSKQNKPDTPKPAVPELLFDCDHFVFGGGSASIGQVLNLNSEPDAAPSAE